MKLEHYETVIRCLPLAQRAIALVLKLLNLPKVNSEPKVLVLNLRSKFKVRDEGPFAIYYIVIYSVKHFVFGTEGFKDPRSETKFLKKI